MKKQQFLLPCLPVLYLLFVFAILASFDLSVFADASLYGVYVTQNSSSVEVSSQVSINGGVWIAGNDAPQILTGNNYTVYAGAVEISTDTGIGNINANYNEAVINSPAPDIVKVFASNINLDTLLNIGGISSNENFVSVKDAQNVSDSVFASNINIKSAGIGIVNVNLNKAQAQNSKISEYICGVMADITLSSSSAFNINSNGNEVSISYSSSYGAIASDIRVTTGVANAISENNKITVLNSTINIVQASSLYMDSPGHDGESSAKTEYNSVSITDSYSDGFIMHINASYASSNNVFANYNQVVIDGMILNNDFSYIEVASAYGNLSAQANENVLDLKNITANVQAFDIRGGSAYSGHDALRGTFANKNYVKVENINASGDAGIYGGYAVSAGAFANANENSVQIASSSIAEVYGGYAESTDSLFEASHSANQNFVELINSFAYEIYGGKSYSYGVTGGFISNFANGNEVHITSGSSVIVCAGYAQSDTLNAQSNNNILDAEEILYGVSFAGGCVSAPAADAKAYGNFVTVKSAKNIDGGRIAGGLVGQSVNADITFNSVVLNDVVFNNGLLFGGVVFDAAEIDAFVNNNAISIKGGNLNVSIYGGGAISNNGNAQTNGNSVEMNGGILNGIAYGGLIQRSINGSAGANYVKFKNVSGNIDIISGGQAYANRQAFANGNEIIIENISARVGSVIGGGAQGTFEDGEIQAVNNTISITGNLTVDNVLYGGYAQNAGAGGADNRSGNSLNAIGGQISAYGIGGFENYNFFIRQLNVLTPMLYASNGDGQSFFGGTDGALDVSSANIRVFLPANANVGSGHEFHLMESGFGFTQFSASKITEKQGFAWLNDFDIYVDTNSNVLTARFSERTLNPQTKNLSEGIAAGAALIGQGADIADGLLTNINEENIEVLGAVFGGSSKYDTGSGVEINSLGLIAGAAAKFKPLTVGVFAEYAGASYDAENDFENYDSVKGDGKASYAGGGLLAKKDIKENIYVEGQIRAGQISNDYKPGLSDGQGNTADFDYSSIYFGLNIGAGYKYKASEKIILKGYGKYIFTNIGGQDAVLSAGETYEIGAVTSNRIKAGIKGSYEINKKVKPYIGIACDYEISGEINAKISGAKIVSPTLNGATVQGELGASVKATENLNIDVSAQIYAGAREGFCGLLKLKYEIL